MMNRIRGALRDMWWLLLLFLAATIGVGLVIGAIVAIIVWIVVVSTFAYFACVRYDDTGHERSDID